MCRIRFEPWIGSRYDLCEDDLSYKIPRPPIFGSSRVLILGESHYTDHGEDEYTRDFTSKIVRNHRVNHPFFLRVQEACLGQGIGQGNNAMNPKKFWHSVAFYNYVQWFVRVVPGPRVSPTPQMFTKSRDAFRQCLNCLRPTHVIACGFGLWQHLLPDMGPGPVFNNAILDAFNGRLGYFHYDGDGICRIAAIKHPAAFVERQQYWQYWHPRLQLFFALPPL